MEPVPLLLLFPPRLNFNPDKNLRSTFCVRSYEIVKIFGCYSAHKEFLFAELSFLKLTTKFIIQINNNKNQHFFEITFLGKM